MTEWPPGRGFALNVRYEQPEPLRLPSDGAVVTLGLSCRTGDSSHGFSISEQAHILLKPLPRLTPDQINAEFVRPLQNLLSFATDTPNAIEGVELRGERVAHGGVETNRKYHLVFNPIFRLKSKKDRLRPNEMLFTFDESQGAGLNSLPELVRVHEEARGILHGVLRLAIRTSEVSRREVPPAHDGAHASHFIPREISQSGQGSTWRRSAAYRTTGSRKRNGLYSGTSCPTGPEVEMPFHLLRLLEVHRRLMNPLIGEDHRAFVMSLSETLSFAERRTAETNRPPLQGGELLYAMEKIRILIKAVVLKELGFADEQVASFIQRNRYYIYMSSGDAIRNP